ncbi:rod shape-determining protein RodA [Bacteroides sp. 519]|uniref:rod shape-determining protein RodA n=1 Tax=Bacteroides sp. 519 TaxID=2302937 RepID=UPI0013D11CB1|nr:rod shape-determining protein RodA [Bacteroides sp. 519]NDV59923.1 rod shape-determining protein RodA [Bacteroides sp. 519]
MSSRTAKLWKNIDWITICIYLILIVAGWFTVCGASYDYGERDFLDFSTRSGKQFIWIVCSFGLAFILMMLEDTMYDMFSYIIYIGMILLLIVTIFIAPDVKGSRSWLQMGPVSIQPAEFAKFATALALAKYMNSYSYDIKQLKFLVPTVLIFIVPMMLIILQKETGSALVYLAFFLVLYREGMSGIVLFLGVCAVVYFIVGIKYDEVPFMESPTSVGVFTVFCLILLFTIMFVWTYMRRWDVTRNLLLVCVSVLTISVFVLKNVEVFDVSKVLWGLTILVVGYLAFMAIKDRKWTFFWIAVFTIGSAIFLYSSDYVFDKILEPHQRVRIKVVLGMEEDLAGAGYNVNQSKIAIGSGGLTGKGFLNGTQTKLKYVPEQDTDFIFCTIGEEQGFAGSVAVLILYGMLIVRLIMLAERQSHTFGRVYGYSVLSIFFFHLFINIGMVLGLTPVIGIPLPFFSYGGSSLWGFTILLFVFLRIDAGRGRRF